MSFGVPFEPEMMFRVFFSCLLGGFMGWERERHGISTAGIRTYSAIALGACAFGIIGQHMTPADPAHFTAQIISGIGFLGAGIMFRQGDYMTGITTAATLWATASIGLAVAFGMYANALAITLLLFLLMYLPRMKWWRKISKKKVD